MRRELKRSTVFSVGLFLVMLSSLIAAPVDASARQQEDAPTRDPCTVAGNGAFMKCGDEIIRLISGSPGRFSDDTYSTDAPDSSSSTTTYVPYERIVDGGGPNGETCVTTGYREVPAGVDPIIGTMSDTRFRDITRTYPACPISPESPAQADTPAIYALRYWQNIPVPSPQPYIAPGRAITGMYAYLETRGTTTHTYTEPSTPFGPLTLVATGKYYVDWGDGTRTGPHYEEGEPWPDGDIKHEYINVGFYDVVVTEKWTATWSFGEASGTTNALRSEGRIEDFPVQQIQAVVFQ